MKKISKKKLDKVIELSRDYWQCDQTEDQRRVLLNRRYNLCEALGKETGVVFFAFDNFIGGIIAGFCPDAENDEIYCALRCLGWEVTDEDEESEGL